MGSRDSITPILAIRPGYQKAWIPYISCLIRLLQLEINAFNHGGGKKKHRSLWSRPVQLKGRAAIFTMPKHPMNNDQSRNHALLIESNVDSEQKRKGFGSSIKVEKEKKNNNNNEKENISETCKEKWGACYRSPHEYLRPARILPLGKLPY